MPIALSGEVLTAYFAEGCIRKKMGVLGGVEWIFIINGEDLKCIQGFILITDQYHFNYIIFFQDFILERSALFKGKAVECVRGS